MIYRTQRQSLKVKRKYFNGFDDTHRYDNNLKLENTAIVMHCKTCNLRSPDAALDILR